MMLMNQLLMVNSVSSVTMNLCAQYTLKKECVVTYVIQLYKTALLDDSSFQSWCHILNLPCLFSLILSPPPSLCFCHQLSCNVTQMLTVNCIQNFSKILFFYLKPYIRKIAISFPDCCAVIIPVCTQQRINDFKQTRQLNSSMLYLANISLGQHSKKSQLKAFLSDFITFKKPELKRLTF